MGSKPDISVIVVSRDRPVELQKMLACLRFQDISGFEVIVVTNTPSALNPDLQPSPLRVFDCDEANISIARNVGLAAASGRYVAFCDDDALPDPSWLRLLLAPFSNPKIGGTGGFTRGRNGISLQWGAVETDLTGVAHPLDIAPDSAPVVFGPSTKSAPVMIGTNSAFRVTALKQIGGFDPAFAYYLDDSDISLRLSKAGWHLAIVPKAQVHHGFAAGPYRSQNRVPKTLQPHGKSVAVFCRKHADEQALKPALQAFSALQFKRLEMQMLAGLMEPPHLPKLMKTLVVGYDSGSQITLNLPPVSPKPIDEPAPEFDDVCHKHVLLVGRPQNKKWMQSLAKTLSAEKIIVTALTLNRSPAFLQVTFSSFGYWQHTGGQFGKATRNEPIFKLQKLAKRAKSEALRLAGIRAVDLLVYPRQIAPEDIILPQKGAMECINGYLVESV